MFSRQLTAAQTMRLTALATLVVAIILLFQQQTLASALATATAITLVIVARSMPQA